MRNKIANWQQVIQVQILHFYTNQLECEINYSSNNRSQGTHNISVHYEIKDIYRCILLVVNSNSCFQILMQIKVPIYRETLCI